MQSLLHSTDNQPLGPPAEVMPLNVAFLTSFIPPYCLPVFQELGRRVRKLTILLSTPMEANRNWRPEWGDLDVRIQKTSTFHRPLHHPGPFQGSTYVHIPWDTGRQLKSLRPDVVISAEFGLRSFLSA